MRVDDSRAPAPSSQTASGLFSVLKNQISDPPRRRDRQMEDDMCISAAQRDALDSYEFTERELARYKRDGFEVVVRAEPETIIPLEEYARD